MLVQRVRNSWNIPCLEKFDVSFQQKKYQRSRPAYEAKEIIIGITLRVSFCFSLKVRSVTISMRARACVCAWVVEFRDLLLAIKISQYSRQYSNARILIFSAWYLYLFLPLSLCLPFLSPSRFRNYRTDYRPPSFWHKFLRFWLIFIYFLKACKFFEAKSCGP